MTDHTDTNAPMFSATDVVRALRDRHAGRPAEDGTPWGDWILAEAANHIEALQEQALHQRNRAEEAERHLADLEASIQAEVGVNGGLTLVEREARAYDPGVGVREGDDR